MAILIMPPTSIEVLYDKEAFNAALNDWLKEIEADAKVTMYQSGIRGITLRGKSYKRSGLIYRLSLTYSRKAIWIHYGASRGHGGMGSCWTNRQGEKVDTNPRSYGLMNTGLRRAKPWKDNIFTKNLPALEQIVSRYAKGMIIKVYG